MVEMLALRAVVFQESGWWIAQCLEHDLCTSAKDRKELTHKLVSQLRLQLLLDLVKGKKPFQDLPRAPQRFWEMYSGASEEVVQIRSPWLANLFLLWRGDPRIQASIALAAA